jgi:hypothetical protein
MRLIGFNFTKIQAERFKDKTESIKFNSKVNISSIEIIKSEIIKTKEEIIKVNFNYLLSYEPEFAKIELSGNAILSLDSKMAKQVSKGFNDKGTPDDFKIFVLNIILKKVNLKSLQLEEELNLPIHLPLISLNKDSLKEKKEDN